MIDRVNPGDESQRTWRHPWHLSTEEISTDESGVSFATTGEGANLRILPIDPDNNMNLTIVKDHTQPVLQGWKVWGGEAKPHVVPMHSWSASEPFTKAWILLPRNAEQATFEVADVSSINSNGDRLSFRLNRTDGGHDVVVFDNQQRNGQLGRFAGRRVSGNLAVVRVQSDGTLESVLETE